MECKNKEKLIENFNKEFGRYCSLEDIVAEYVRFDPWICNFEDFSSIYNVFTQGDIYCNDLAEDFFAKQYSTDVRNMIRKAEKSGVKVEFDFEGKYIKDFLKLYDYTAEKYNISDFYKLDEKFLNEYFEKLPNKVFIANARYNEDIISTAIILIGNDIVHFHFSAKNPEYRK